MGSLVVLLNCVDTGWGLDRSRHKKTAWLCSKQAWPWFVIWCLPEFRRTKSKFQARFDGEGIWDLSLTANNLQLEKPKRILLGISQQTPDSWLRSIIWQSFLAPTSSHPIARPRWAMSKFLAKLCPWSRNKYLDGRKIQFVFQRIEGINSILKFSSTLFLLLFVSFFCWVQPGIMNTKGTL